MKSLFCSIIVLLPFLLVAQSTYVIHNGDATHTMVMPSGSMVVYAINADGTLYGGNDSAISSVVPSTDIPPGASCTITVPESATAFGSFTKWAGGLHTVIYYVSGSSGPVTAYNGYPNTSGLSPVVPIGSSCYLSFNYVGKIPPPVFTNIVLVAYNSGSTPQRVNFYWNNVSVKTEILAAGYTDTWTSPPVQTSPNPENWTSQVVMSDPNVTLGQDGVGGLQFTNPFNSFSSSGSGSDSTNAAIGGSYTSLGGTNTFTVGGSSVYAQTNGVLWSAPSGSASESTLQSGFSLLHNDSQNILGGQSILNNTLKAGFLDVTNSLGQLVRLQTAFSNETLQVISAITNLGSVGSSNSSVFPTNLATESTLQGISNLLSSGATNYDTNTDAASSGWLSLASTYMSSGSNSLISLGAGVDSTPAWSVDTRFGSDTINWVVNIPYCGNYNVDLNPFHLSWVAELAAWIRFFLKWAFIAALIVACIDDVLKAISSFAAAHASSSTSHSVIGSVVSAVTHPIGTVLSLGVSLVMAKILMMVISFATNWFAGYLATFAANPFGSSLSTYVSEAIWMLDQFVPLSVMTACVFCHYLFKLALAAVVWSVNIAIRFIVGL